MCIRDRRYCFHAGGAAAAMGVPALCMAALSFPIAAVSIILSAAFQSLGHLSLIHIS